MATNDTRSGLGSFISGLLLGGLVGAAIAILNAPQSGEQTIAQLKDKSDQIRKELERAATDTRQQAEELLERLQTKEEQAPTQET